MNNYKRDISISLCKQDIEFAQNLVKALNPSLKIFSYEYNQEEIITKSGPEAFSRIFKEESRIVIILSRKEWSESFYTEIERNAILDRVKNEGFGFLFVVPMEQGQTPIWYPSTRIYADPLRFSIKQLAEFIEFKVTEEGGIIKPITLEDRYQNFLSRIEEKKKIIQLQTSREGISEAENEIKCFKDLFNQKIDVLHKNIFDKIQALKFSEYQNNAYCAIGEYLLECSIDTTDELYNKIVTTQDFPISFQLFKLFGSNNEKKLIEEESLSFFYSPIIKGWAKPFLYEHASQKELTVLFRNRNNSKYYDLKNPISSQILVDSWFQKLLIAASFNIERYL